MDRLTDARLILDGPWDGPWNMAVDEALLASAAQERTATLRVYGWSEPTLSLGYFQDYHQRREHRPSLGCLVVRRPSGGGAILHDRELTYSFATPVADRITFDFQNLYQTIHGAWVDALNRFQIPAKMWKAACKKSASDEPFLCFQRRFDGDLVLSDAKICGSAQRRLRRAVLQHGSVLWSQSPFAPELLGVKELASQHLDEERLRDEWLERMATGLGLRFRPGALTDEEIATATSLADKHRRMSWIAGRKSPPPQLR